MPLYFMHLVDGADVLLDPEGMEMPLEKVSAAALLQARDCMAGDVRMGRLDLGFHIEVHDEHGQIVHRLDFPDALEILRAR